MNQLEKPEFPKFDDAKGIDCKSNETLTRLNKIIPAKILCDTYSFNEVLITNYKEKADKCIVFRNENEWGTSFVCVGYRGTYIKRMNGEKIYISINWRGRMHSITVSYDDAYIVYSPTFKECNIYYNDKLIYGYNCGKKTLVYRFLAWANSMLCEKQVDNEYMTFTPPGYNHTDSLTLAKRALRIHNLMYITYCWSKTELLRNALMNPVMAESAKEHVEDQAKEPVKEKIVEKIVEKVVYVEKKEPSNECVICMHNQRNVAFIPCGHHVSCRECGEKCETCPICRAAVNNVLTIYA